MTSTEWEITTLGLLEKLRARYLKDDQLVADIKSFIYDAILIWIEEEKRRKQ